MVGGLTGKNHSSDWAERDRIFVQTLRWVDLGLGTIEAMGRNLEPGKRLARDITIHRARMSIGSCWRKTCLIWSPALEGP